MTPFASPSTCCIRNINFWFNVKIHLIMSEFSELHHKFNPFHTITVKFFGTSILGRLCCTSNIIGISELAAVGDLYVFERSCGLRKSIQESTSLRAILMSSYTILLTSTYDFIFPSWCFFLVLIYLQRYLIRYILLFLFFSCYTVGSHFYS